MATAFDDVLGAVMAALQSAPALAGGNIVENDDGPLDAADSARIVVRLTRARGELGAIRGAPVDWESEVEIECQAGAASGVRAALNELVGGAYARIAADPTLGGLVLQIALDPEIVWDYQIAERELGRALLTAKAQHRTAEANLNTA